jgi:beta-xylosidase
VPITNAEAYLRMEVREGDVSFSYSLDGTTFTALGKGFAAKQGVWIGAKVGLFASGDTRTGEFGFADFDWIRFARLP